MMHLRGRPWIAVMAIAILALVAVLGVNAFDEELTPEARALFARANVPFVQQSVWALIAGFHAQAGEDPRAFAASLRRAALQRKPGQAVVPAQALELRAAAELLCAPQDVDCVRAFAQRPDAVDDAAADNRLLLERYDELQKSSQLVDVFEGLDFYASEIPHFVTVMRTQQLALSLAGANASRGRHAEAVAWLDKDASFQRRWLEQAGSTLAKMLAQRGLSRDVLVAGQVARSGASLSTSEWEALERIVQPLTLAQRALAPVQRIDATLFANVLDELIADSRRTSGIVDAPRFMSAIAAATLRRNATLNFAYPLFADWAALDGVPSVELASAIDRLETRAREHLAPDWRWIYNYTGRRYAGEGRLQAAEYVYRLRDLDALTATMRCVIALHRQTATPAAAGAVVASSPACTDPYEGRPLSWDAQAAELSFRARSPGQVSRLGGRGDRVVFKAFAGS